jgi:hypothetical protein
MVYTTTPLAGIEIIASEIWMITTTIGTLQIRAFIPEVVVC